MKPGYFAQFVQKVVWLLRTQPSLAGVQVGDKSRQKAAPLASSNPIKQFFYPATKHSNI